MVSIILEINKNLYSFTIKGLLLIMFKIKWIYFLIMLFCYSTPAKAENTNISSLIYFQSSTHPDSSFPNFNNQLTRVYVNISKRVGNFSVNVTFGGDTIETISVNRENIIQYAFMEWSRNDWHLNLGLIPTMYNTMASIFWPFRLLEQHSVIRRGWDKESEYGINISKSYIKGNIRLGAGYYNGIYESNDDRDQDYNQVEISAFFRGSISENSDLKLAIILSQEPYGFPDTDPDYPRTFNLLNKISHFLQIKIDRFHFGLEFHLFEDTGDYFEKEDRGRQYSLSGIIKTSKDFEIFTKYDYFDGDDRYELRTYSIMGVRYKPITYISIAPNIRSTKFYTDLTEDRDYKSTLLYNINFEFNM